MLGRLVDASAPAGLERLADGSVSTSMSRLSMASPASDAESAAERGTDLSLDDEVVPLALAAPGNGIPVLVPLGPMALHVDRMVQGNAGQPLWLSKQGGRRVRLRWQEAASLGVSETLMMERCDDRRNQTARVVGIRMQSEGLWRPIGAAAVMVTSNHRVLEVGSSTVAAGAG